MAASADSPPLVGRQRELTRIEAALARVAGGEPGVLAFAGAPGAGTSRLVRETVAMAASAGFTAATGHADDAGEVVGYAPFVEAYGGVLRAMDEKDRASIGATVPQLALLIGGLGVEPPVPLGDPELERMRIMDGFALLTGLLARRAPLVLALDDLQALDPASDAVLRHIAFTVTDQPVLFVLASRHDEPGRESFARRLAGLADSAWWCERVDIGPIDDDDAAELLSKVLGGPISPRLVDSVVHQCGGRPLFLEAVGRSLAEGGKLIVRGGVLEYDGDELPLPETIAEQLGVRLSRLSAEEWCVARTIAVAGGRCDYPLLAAACGLEQQQLAVALDRLADRRLLVADAEAGTYALVHGIVHEVVLASLGPVQQQAQHAALAAALERLRPEDPRITEQLLLAGPLIDDATMIPRLLAAGKHAREIGAVSDAARYLEAALARVSTTPDAALPTRVLAELAELTALAGHHEQAKQHWEHVLDAYTIQNDPIGVSAANRELGMLAWLDGDGATADAVLTAAERALDGLEPGPEHAELLYQRMTVAVRIGDAETVTRTAAALRELEDRVASPTLSIRAALAQAAQELVSGEFTSAERNNRWALVRAQECDDRALEMRAYDQLSVAACIRGDLGELMTYSQASLDLVRRTGASVLEPWPRMRMAVCDLLSGDWDAALRTTSDVLAAREADGSQRGRISSLGTHAWVLVRRGALSDARRYLDEAHGLIASMTGDDRRVSGSIAVADAAFVLATDDRDALQGAADALSELYSSWYPLVALILRGETLVRAGNRAAAKDASSQARSFFRECDTVLPNAVSSWIDGIAAADADALLDAAKDFAAIGFPFHAARSRIERAGLLAAQGTDKEAAIADASAALECFDQIGAPVEAQRARRLLRSLGVVPSRGHPRSAPGATLSARELEVARLVASGRSSAAIATELFISPRTVTTHLDHIYQRLGIGSRAALTRYLADSGLLESHHEHP